MSISGIELCGQVAVIGPCVSLADAVFRQPRQAGQHADGWINTLLAFGTLRQIMASVADDMERLIEQNRRLKFQIEQLQEQLGEYRRTEESLKNALVSSEKLRTEILNEAKKEAELLIDEARLEAKQLYQSAERTREEIKQEITRLALQKERFKAEFSAVLDAHGKLLQADYQAYTEDE